MMKFVVMAALTLSALSANAGQKVCVDRDVQDATLAATFELGPKNMQVDLFIPSGETSGKTVSGVCKSDEGAIELSITCNVLTSTDSGYDVKLQSIGSSKLYAVITPWSMAGPGKRVVLPCDADADEN